MTLSKYDHFTATQILCEIKLLLIQMVKKCYFFPILVNLSNFQVPNLLKNSKFQVSKIAKNDFFGPFEICQNLISHKIWVAVKWSSFNKVKPKNFTFGKFLEHSAVCKLKNIFVTHILREIKVDGFSVSRYVILTHWEALKLYL